MFAEMFSENSDLDNSGTSISVFSCRSDQKLYNVPTTSKMVKKFLVTFKSRTCFADCWKVSSVFQECKNVRDSSVAKNYCLVCLLCVAGKIFDKLLIEKYVITLRNVTFFLCISFGFRSLCSGACILRVVSMELSELLTGVCVTWRGGRLFELLQLTMFDCYILAHRSSLQIQLVWNFRSGFQPVSSFLINRQLWGFFWGSFLKIDSLIVHSLKGSILGLTLLLLYSTYFLDEATYSTSMYNMILLVTISSIGLIICGNS